MAFFALLFLWICTSPLIGDWILKPLVKLVPGLEPPWRFQLSDLIWLMIQLQVVIAVGVQVFDSRVAIAVRVVLILILAAPVLGIWVVSLHVTSRAGITRSVRRGAVFMLVVPLGLVVAVSIPVLVVMFVDTLVSEVHRTFDQPDWIAPASVLALLFATALVAVGLRMLASWAVQKTSPPTNSSAA